MDNTENSNLKSITLNMSDGSQEEIKKGLVLPFDIKLDAEGDQTLTIQMVGISGPEFVYIMKVLAMQAIQMGFFKDDADEDDEEFEKMFVELPDSGDRRDFGTGAVRDMGNKGRCDLLPWDVIGPLLDGDLYGYAAEDLDRFCNLMAQATHSSDQYTIHLMIEQFVGMAYTGSMTSALLEVAYHYEAGARKYSSRNWELGIPVHLFLDSAGRHFLKWLRGDKDEPHDRAVTWNLLGALWTIDHHPNMIKEEE